MFVFGVSLKRLEKCLMGLVIWRLLVILIRTVLVGVGLGGWSGVLRIYWEGGSGDSIEDKFWEDLLGRVEKGWVDVWRGNVLIYFILIGSNYSGNFLLESGSLMM